jgi:hypothetical protein
MQMARSLLSRPGPTANGHRFDPDQGGRLAQAFASVAAQDFLATGRFTDEQLGFSAAHTVVEAHLKQGSTVTLHLGRRAEVEDASHANQLKAQFDALDTEPKDGKLSKAELEKAAKDASMPEPLRKAAARVADDAVFTRFDVGGWSATAKDDVLSREDLDAAAKTIALVPVRLDGDPQIYLVPAYAAEGLEKRIADLRDLTLLAFDAAKAKRLSIQAGGKTVVVAKEAQGWKLIDPKKLPADFEFDPAHVETTLGTLRSLRALRVAEGISEDKAGLKKPSGSVEVLLDGGEKHRLLFGADQPAANGPKDMFVKGSVDNQVYLIAPYVRARFEKGIELFKKLPPPPMNAGGMKGLESLPPEVRKQLEAQLRQEGMMQ